MSITNEGMARQKAPIERPHPRQLVYYALGQRNEQATRQMNLCSETWEETCTTLQITPQHSPFQWDQVGAGVEAHGRLLQRRTPYPHIITTGEQVGNCLHPPNNEHQCNDNVGTDAAQGSCTGRPGQAADND